MPPGAPGRYVIAKLDDQDVGAIAGPRQGAAPEGIEFRIWQARRRLGAQVVNQPGAWNFSDLHTTDPQAAMAFYEEAFGWQVDDLGFATMIRRPGYGDHLEATVDPGIRARQSGVTGPDRLRGRDRLGRAHRPGRAGARPAAPVPGACLPKRTSSG